MEEAMTNEQLLSDLKEKCKACQGCSLYKSRTNCVFGKGNPNARIMFVGEAPGETEDLQGLPFVGKAGKLLDKFFIASGIDKDQIYVANILKCRPPNNRDPNPDEEAVCIEHLREQVRIIKPKIIVCLGKIAAQMLIDPEFRIMKEHGKWITKGNFKITAVFHPALLLRDPSHNEEMLRDLVAIKREIEKVG
jgi:DNA polymerase